MEGVLPCFINFYETYAVNQLTLFLTDVSFCTFQEKQKTIDYQYGVREIISIYIFFGKRVKHLYLLSTFDECP